MSPALYLLAQQGSPASPWLSMAPMIAIFAIFYLLVFYPVRKRQKALQKLIENLKRGDKVITNGGLYGEVAALEDKFVHLKIADNVKVKVSRSAIAGLEGDAEAEGRK